MGPAAYEVIRWTRKQFSDGDELLAFVSELLYTQIMQAEPAESPERRLLLAHAQFFAPEEFGYLAEPPNESEGKPEYLNQLDAMNYGDRLFIGHHHYPTILHYVEEEPERNSECYYDLKRNSTVIVVVGAVGQPRTLKMKDAQYAIYDTQTDRFAFYHVQYDYMKTVEKIRELGFSEKTEVHLLKELMPEK